MSRYDKERFRREMGMKMIRAEQARRPVWPIGVG